MLENTTHKPKLPASSEVSPAPTHAVQTFFHPFSGLLILGLDNVLFGADLFSLGLSTPISMGIGFVGATLGVYWLQKQKSGEANRKSLLKALLAGVITGFPASLSGTFVGGLVLAWSGLSWLRRRRS